MRGDTFITQARSDDNSRYRIRVFMSIILVELVVAGLIQWWPEIRPESKKKDFVYEARPNERIEVEDIAVTQQSQPASPPSPQVPVVRPDDEVIEADVPDFNELNLPALPGKSEFMGSGGTGESNAIAKDPELGPSVVKIVEPTIPKAARENNIKAEIYVSFLVDTLGNVEEATISQIRLYKNGGSKYEVVRSIGYGLPEATIKAAMQWKFRPARDDGRPVRAYTRHVFSYGF